ncbi:hypothetical protein LOD99_4978 [Oopsacas minuta]|uniref:Uncharacterized protein n=1 Tax=Oopsacas minuta TaxID=111878 RepID=A0AAV7JTG5_9METZ|nr:hypothetical protein LOD99_4978 [Oopsacas minuta]
MTEPLAKLDQKMEKRMNTIDYSNENAEIDEQQIGTIIYKLNMETEIQTESKSLTRREFNWDSGQVDGRKRDFRPLYSGKKYQSSSSKVLSTAKSIGQAVYTPFNLYSKLLFFWVKTLTGGISKQDLRMKNSRTVFGLITSIYMASMWYGISHTVTVLSISITYSSLLVE